LIIKCLQKIFFNKKISFYVCKNTKEICIFAKQKQIFFKNFSTKNVDKFFKKIKIWNYF